MKSSIKGLFVILAIIMSLVAVQGVCAETVEGTIETISTHPNMIKVGETEVYGVMFNYLDNKHGIVLSVGLDVKVEAYKEVCSDGTIKLKACKIAVEDGDFIDLRECQQS